MPLSLFLAWRFLGAAKQEKTITIMIRICFLSIVIGTCALTLVAAIMKGFEQATYAKLQGVHADLTINAYDKAIDFEKLSKVITDEYKNQIIAFSPTSLCQVIISNPNKTKEYTICMLKAVDPKREPQVTKIHTMIAGDAKDPWQLLSSKTIFIGTELARTLGVAVGDTVTLLYPEDTSFNRKVSLEEKEVRVAALFKTGIHDFDEHIIISSFALAQRLFHVPVTQVSIRLAHLDEETAVIESLKKRLSLEVCSWKELYPSLMSALILEKYAMICMLALVALVASLTIISLLFMYITHKRPQIALLKSLGMKDRSIIAIFMMISCIITLAATVCGVTLAACISTILKQFPFIKLPDIYYAAHLPAMLDFQIVFWVILFAFIMSLLAAILPSRRIQSVSLTSVMRGTA